MRTHEDEIARAGARIAAIGTGDVVYARQFKADHAIDFPLLVDDEGLSYQAVEAGWGGLGGLLAPTVLARGVRVLAGGTRQGRRGRAPLRLGATHVIRPDESVPFAWRNDDYADDPPIGEVLRALA